MDNNQFAENNQPVVILAALMKDRYWSGTLHLFLNNDKLKRHVAQYIDFNRRSINAASLKRISKPWSQSERFLLNLALHLYNESNKVNLSDMDYLDPKNRELAFEAIKRRYGC